MNKKAVLIDGNALMFRSFYGTIKQLDYYKQNNLTPVNAIKSMMLIIFKLLTTNKYDYGLIAFDHFEPNFRKKQYSEYKAKRSKTPDELICQINPIKTIMPLFGLNTFCIPGIEADDVVASGVNILNKNGIFCDVYSCDNDLLQLVNNNTNVIQFKKGLEETICYTNNNFSFLFHDLLPNQVTDYKGIVGDNSDNLPGIKGIGPKTAVTLLKQFNSLENIYNNLDFIESQTIRSKFLKDKEISFMCKKLAILVSEFFNDKNVNDLLLKPINYDKLSQIIKDYHFKGFDKYLGVK